MFAFFLFYAYASTKVLLYSLSLCKLNNFFSTFGLFCSVFDQFLNEMDNETLTNLQTRNQFRKEHKIIEQKQEIN